MRGALLVLSLAFVVAVTHRPWWGPLPFLLLPPFWLMLHWSFAERIRASLGWFWLVAGLELLPLLLLKPALALGQGVLPLGLSFLVFQALSFTHDWRRRKITGLPRLPDYLLYLLFFPKFLAGPIERFSTFRDEAKRAGFRKPEILRGLELITLGLAKKFLLANYLRALTAPWFDQAGAPASFLEALSVTYAFAIEFYCDFSAYTDLALGVALLFGVRLSENFNRPYLALNVQDFWQRWHITLSAWFRDYVHFPLFFTVKNLSVAVFTTFFLMGLWHGLGANYLALGAYWGVVMMLYSGLQPWRLRIRSTYGTKLWWRPACLLVTFHVVAASFFLLRAEGGLALQKLAWLEPWRLTPFTEQSWLRIAFALPLLVCVEMARHHAGGFFALSKAKKVGVLALLAYYSLILFTFTEERGLTDVRFLYFQF